MNLPLLLAIALVVAAILIRLPGSSGLMLRWTFVAIALYLVAVSLWRGRRQWTTLTGDHQEDRVSVRLDSFMEHLNGCSACNLDRGREGLCASGRALYSEKEQAEMS